MVCLFRKYKFNNEERKEKSLNEKPIFTDKVNLKAKWTYSDEDKISNRFYIKRSFSDLKNTIGIADKFYDNAFFSIRAIPLRMRFAIVVARRVYRRIGYNVLRCGNFETYENSGRIYVRNFEKIFETIFSLFDLLKLFLAKRSANTTAQYHRLINEDIDYNARF